MESLIPTLKSNLEEIAGIQEVFMYRNAQPTAYPALICIWERTDNTFETNKENLKTAVFRLYITTNVSGKSMKTVDETIMPKLYDSVSNYIDENWNFGTSVDGHRMWTILSVVNSSIVVEDKNKLAVLECELQLRYLKDN